ncbi:MAG: hypothetical protein LBE65_01395 [Synergistaceae bacterium]|jgi:hypothetical protein|nr:hypothetical protein [Synergistaceae bacterium]
MASNTRKEAVEHAVNGLLNEEAAIVSADPYRYSLTASAAFEEIALLRGKGMRFEKICAAFAKAGLLPNDAKPHSLSQAFLREKRRREKTARTEGAGTAEKSSATETNRAARVPQKTVQAAPDSGAEAAEKEWIRKQTSMTVDTGLGKITRNSDGSFDYD